MQCLILNPAFIAENFADLKIKVHFAIVRRTRPVGRKFDDNGRRAFQRAGMTDCLSFRAPDKG
ncbi:hypothetical protein CWR43_29775 [Rhizobium sullae]|uniref:Uncharacterized protein n=1 Tax=Rhizobium sullae TaxID=50338 RepID=A0A2N0D215_RHISU|nr:hypothetical protein CWR43_29775 [Rhizobium sullae]